MREASSRLGEPVEQAMRRLRLDEGLSNHDIAERIGVPFHTVTRWMTVFGLTWPQLAAEAGARRKLA